MRLMVQRFQPGDGHRMTYQKILRVNSFADLKGKIGDHCSRTKECQWVCRLFRAVALTLIVGDTMKQANESKY